MTLKVPKAHTGKPSEENWHSRPEADPAGAQSPGQAMEIALCHPSVTRCFGVFGWSQVLVPDAAGRGSRLIQFGETFAALLFFTWLPGAMQPAARLTAARLDPRLESILVGIPCVSFFCVQQAGRFLPCPTPDHWQLRNQARPRHSFPERPLSTERPLKGDPDGREARANLMKPNTEGCWLFDVISRWFLKYCLFPSLFGEDSQFD